jgi:hypothetical protein
MSAEMYKHLAEENDQELSGKKLAVDREAAGSSHAQSSAKSDNSEPTQSASMHQTKNLAKSQQWKVSRTSKKHQHLAWTDPKYSFKVIDDSTADASDAAGCSNLVSNATSTKLSSFFTN